MKTSNLAAKMRDKRKQYQISQHDISALCGISRVYYSRLESGKDELTLAMYDFIMERLGRFDPDIPLTMLFDYVRIRFRTDDLEYVIENILRMKLQYFIHEDYAFYSYAEHYYLGDIFVMTAPGDEKMGVLLELKGRGCRQFEMYLQAQGRNWYDFFMACMAEEGTKFKRIDLAINDRTGILDIPRLADKCKKEECVSLFRKFNFQGSGAIKRRDEKDGMGNTLYIGSTQSDIFFCVYEKDYEEYAKKGIPIEDAEVKNRFEIRLKNDRALHALVDLVSRGNEEETAFDIINRYIRFVDRDDSRPQDEWETSADWARFIGEGRGKLRLTTEPEPYNVQRTINWYTHQVVASEKMLRIIDGYKGTNIMKDIYDSAVLTDKHKKIIRQHTVTPEEVVDM